MVEIATAVEHDLADTRIEGTLGDELAHLGSTFDIATMLAGGLNLLVKRGRACQRDSSDIIDDLSVDVGIGTRHAQARTLGRTRNLATHTALATLQFRLLCLELIHTEPFSL